MARVDGWTFAICCSCDLLLVRSVCSVPELRCLTRVRSSRRLPISQLSGNAPVPLTGSFVPEGNSFRRASSQLHVVAPTPTEPLQCDLGCSKFGIRAARVRDRASPLELSS